MFILIRVILIRVMFVCHPGFDLWRLAAQPAAIQARAARIRCPSSDAKSAGVAPPGGRQGTGQLRLPAARRGMFRSGDATRACVASGDDIGER